MPQSKVNKFSYLQNGKITLVDLFEQRDTGVAKGRAEAEVEVEVQERAMTEIISSWIDDKPWDGDVGRICPVQDPATRRRSTCNAFDSAKVKWALPSWRLQVSDASTDRSSRRLA